MHRAVELLCFVCGSGVNDTKYMYMLLLLRGWGLGARLVPMCCCCCHWFLQVFRHGDRSPVGTFPNDHYANYWPQGFGQLSKVWHGSRKVYLVQVDVQIPASFLGSAPSCSVHLHVHLTGKEFKVCQITCKPGCDCNIICIGMVIMWCGC